jgi:hypothetical protein
MTSKTLLIILLSIVIVAGIGVSIFLFSTKYTPFDSHTGIPVEEIAKLSEEDISQAEIDELPGCVAAYTPLPLGELTGLTHETKNRLIHYRQSWQYVCSGKSDHSIYPLWIEAKELTKTTYTNSGVLGSALCEENKMINGECATDITAYAPGIKGVYAEGMLLDFTPSRKLFSENIILGTQEDKDFFATYALLGLEDDNFSPWIEQTWDYGGCTKYGSYDWVGVLDTLDKLSKKINNLGYLEEINLYKSELLNGVTNNMIGWNYEFKDPKYPYVKPHICTCDKKNEVLSDLDKVLQYSKNHLFYYDLTSAPGPGHPSSPSDLSPSIIDFINKIKEGKINVLSDAERHCSGG